ncbi:hypothetical protein V8C86DRAFT_2753684 [Haematococcus lacustris]
MSTDHGLRLCEHQVGGHMTKESKPDTLVDDAGRFYKPYQGDARSAREVAFYQLVWNPPAQLPSTSPLQRSYSRPRTTRDPLPPNAPAATPEPLQPVVGEGGSEGIACRASPAQGSASGVRAGEGVDAGVWGVGALYGPAAGTPPLEQDLMGLRAFVPRMFGTAEVVGRQYCVMEDVCHAYLQPCVLDVKMGYVTQYAWATDAYREKCRAKDQATTQSSMGFRISGLQVYRQQEGEMKKMGRSWGKTLTQDTLHQAFTLFADNGALTPGQVWAPSSPAIVRLQQLLAWLEQQTSFCFFQASLLFTYEGTATSLDTANLQVHFIDFAHTFPTPRTPDLNVLTALQSLLALLAKLSDQR